MLDGSQPRPRLAETDAPIDLSHRIEDHHSLSGLGRPVKDPVKHPHSRETLVKEVVYTLPLQSGLEHDLAPRLALWPAGVGQDEDVQVDCQHLI